jgi:hypothetical protein
VFDLLEGKRCTLETFWIAANIIDFRMEVENDHNGLRDRIA